MQADNITIVWGLVLVFFALIGVMVALMYYADKKPTGKKELQGKENSFQT